LNNKSTSHLATIVAETSAAISSGMVTCLHLAGDEWKDEHVAELVRLLLPGYSATGAFMRSASTAKQSQSRLGSLTDLRITGGERLTDKAMFELSKLASLKKLHMTGWSVETDNAMMLIKFVLLPELELLEIPTHIRFHEFFPGGDGWYKALKARFRPTVVIQ
jgi:hypothetical protein